MLKEVIAKELLKAVLEHKEEYLAAIKEAILAFISQIVVDGHDQPVIDELKQNVGDIIAKVKATYDLLHSIVDKYGHPEVQGKK